jgi:anti-anti-sigma factor
VDAANEAEVEAAVPVPENELIRGQHDLTITISGSGAQRCLLRVVGEVDFATSPLLRALLEQQLACGRTYARLDMSSAAFIDTAGVKVLLDMHRNYLAARGTLVILGATATLHCLLWVLELDSVLLVAADTTHLVHSKPPANRRNDRQAATGRTATGNSPA